MDLEFSAWYCGALLLCFCVGYSAGAIQRATQQVMEASS